MLRQHAVVTLNEITLCNPLDLGKCYSLFDCLLTITDNKVLFHLMLRPHVASTANEIMLIGSHINSGMKPTGIMQ